MSYLILVRHAMPEIVEGVPARRWGLSAIGREAAERLARRLETYLPMRVFTSPEPKADETAEVLSRHLALDLETHTDLAEHRRDDVPFLDASRFTKAVRNCIREPDRLVFGSETGRQALDRFTAAVDEILRQTGDENVVVVSHGTVLSLYLGARTGEDPVRIWERLEMPGLVVLPR